MGRFFKIAFLLVAVVCQRSNAQPICPPFKNPNADATKSACLIRCEAYYTKNPEARPSSTARTCESLTETLLAHLAHGQESAKTNDQVIKTCASGVWQGVLSLPEQMRAYGQLLDGLGSSIHQGLVEHGEWVDKCSADASCKRELARMMPEYRVRKPNSNDYLVSDSKVDEGIKNIDLVNLAMTVDENRNTLQKSCESQLPAIDHKIRDGMNGADWGFSQSLQRYNAIAAFDPDCPRAMKLDKPQRHRVHGARSPTWIESLGIQWDCYPPEKVDELICLEFAKQVIDPVNLLGGGALALKAAKIAGVKLAAKFAARGVAEGMVDDAAGLATKDIATKLGRTLSVEDRAAIEKAHQIGAGEKGRDGTPARIGNYTTAQLRRKYLALKDHFSSQEIRDLMESGAVGIKEDQLTEKVLEAFQEVEDQTRPLIEGLDTSKRSSVSRLSEFQDFQKQVDVFKAKQEEILQRWDPASAESTAKTRSDLAHLQSKIARAREEAALWQKRQSVSDWGVIREEPKALAPNRIYKIKTDRGEEVRVLFSEKVAREMVWQSADDLRAKAGDASVEALARGFTRGGASSGLERMTLFGEKIVKIQVVGRGLGAYRIYGVEEDGVVYFVNWEHESLHDKRYLRRALENTKRAYQLLDKAKVSD